MVGLASDISVYARSLTHARAHTHAPHTHAHMHARTMTHIRIRTRTHAHARTPLTQPPTHVLIHSLIANHT